MLLLHDVVRGFEQRRWGLILRDCGVPPQLPSHHPLSRTRLHLYLFQRVLERGLRPMLHKVRRDRIVKRGVFDEPRGGL